MWAHMCMYVSPVRFLSDTSCFPLAGLCKVSKKHQSWRAKDGAHLRSTAWRESRSPVSEVSVDPGAHRGSGITEASGCVCGSQGWQWRGSKVWMIF